MTATTMAPPVIDLNTIRSILYLGLKGDVSLTAPEPVADQAALRAARTARAAPAARTRRGGVDTWA